MNGYVLAVRRGINPQWEPMVFCTLTPEGKEHAWACYSMLQASGRYREIILIRIEGGKPYLDGRLVKDFERAD